MPFRDDITEPLAPQLILGHHHEDQAIDEAQKLIEPVGQIDFAGFQLGGKIRVGFKKAGAEHFERELDLVGKAVSCNFAFA